MTTSIQFAEPGLAPPEVRSYIELTTNTGRIRGLTVFDHLNGFRQGKLPLNAAPGLLHEATHHWCFMQPVGVAIAMLHACALARATILDNRDVLTITPTPNDIKEMLDALFPPMFAVKFLQPISEGLALFCEFDCSGTNLEYFPMPFAIASPSMSGIQGCTIKETADAFAKHLSTFRRSQEMVDRKSLVLGGSLSPRRNPYLCGYLAVKSLWSYAAGFCPVLSSPDLFLIFLSNYIFQDWKFIEILLSPITKPEDMSELGSRLATRIRDRLQALKKPEIYRTIPDYLALSGNETFSTFDKPSSNDHILSFTNESTVASGKLKLNQLETEMGRLASGSEPIARYWNNVTGAISSRDFLVFDLSPAYFRITGSGIGSIWITQTSPYPSVTSLRVSDAKLYGREGNGYGVLLESIQHCVSFAAFVFEGEVIYDTIPDQLDKSIRKEILQSTSMIQERIRYCDIANKILDYIAPDAFKKMYQTSTDKVRDQIYLEFALPHVALQRRLEVSELLSKTGLLPIFPSPRALHLQMFVKLSLGGELDRDFLDWANTNRPDVSLHAIFEEINGRANEIIGSSIIAEIEPMQIITAI